MTVIKNLGLVLEQLRGKAVIRLNVEVLMSLTAYMIGLLWLLSVLLLWVLYKLLHYTRHVTHHNSPFCITTNTNTSTKLMIILSILQILRLLLIRLAIPRFNLRTN